MREVNTILHIDINYAVIVIVIVMFIAQAHEHEITNTPINMKIYKLYRNIVKMLNVNFRSNGTNSQTIIKYGTPIFEMDTLC